MKCTHLEHLARFAHWKKGIPKAKSESKILEHSRENASGKG